MNGLGHTVMGASFGAFASVMTTGAIDLQMIAISTISASFADFDTGSKVRNKLSGNPLRTKIALIATGLASTVYHFLHSYSLTSFSVLASMTIVIVGLFMNHRQAKKTFIHVIASVIGFTGLYYHQYWVTGLAIFIALAPHAAHRTWTHSIWALIAMYFIFDGAQEAGVKGALIGGMAGYVSHIVADMFTVNGVKLFYPLIDKNFGFKIMHSNQLWLQWGIIGATIVAFLGILFITGKLDAILNHPVIRV
ncbi:metal-dependent hydrolase [Ammoniphilus sp. YIM 78166]|uniref:metal-dependent hydrolase n=1 Tax=Ammoniphilus sp. YIM 78166 TaxID=1644106 RepID=UPI0010702FFD|nr:metal-dependent hydrolase [Ammoniphilus sp. YIM 78166]